MTLDSPEIKRIIQERSLYMCLECGKCSASCPRMLTGKEYSPRLMAHKLMVEPEDEAFIEHSLWECLTCGLCEERCPSGVEYTQLMLELRIHLAQAKGLMGERAHDGALHSWMRMMTSPEMRQNRLEWITPELRVTDRGDTAFFTGCAPYFDIFFAGIEVDTLAIVKDSIRLLNFLDITPVVMGEERCCGHDLLWSGDQENFETLCRLNYQEFQAAGVKRVVVSCPECYQVLSGYMPQVIEGFDLEVILLMDLVGEQVRQGGVSFKPLARRVTFQDPCRLGRMADHVRQPRFLLEQIPRLTLGEMASHGRGSLCCGNSAFVNCDAYSKRIQVTRLKEAEATGADMLVTACPKCMIHLCCAMRDPHQGEPLAMEVCDLISLVAEHIQWAQSEKPLAASQ